jgi:catechol 2,3-dioxygenase-like lactoylglutathione lyase family enzyme
MRSRSAHAIVALMPIELLGLRTVIYPVIDLQAAKLWWSTLLGQEPYFDEPFYVGFAVAGYELGLLPDANPVEGAVTYWGVASVPDAIAAAVAVGAIEHSAPTAVGAGITTGSVLNLSGNVIGFIDNPNFQRAD